MRDRQYGPVRLLRWCGGTRPRRRSRTRIVRGDGWSTRPRSRRSAPTSSSSVASPTTEAIKGAEAMPCKLICVSSDDGADAFSAATEVAENLGWTLVDDDIISRAAEEAGVGRDVVADVERRKSLVERLLNTVGTPGASMAYVPT